MPLIRIEHLSKSYDDTHALNDVSFVMESGRKTVILGPSGAGKTTLLRCIAGLETCESGKIFFDDEDVTAKSPAERKVAMIFQSAALFVHTKIKDNIAYGLYKLGYTKGEIETMVMRSAELLHISHLLERYPNMLSGGEKQRASIARAIVRKPSLLLLDEPFSSLDERLREELQAEMMRLQEEIGMTMISVTHDQQEAMNMADTVIFMNNGEIKASGAPEDLYLNPPNLDTAEFIGSPAVNVIHDDTALFARLKEFYHFKDEVRTIAIRPENFMFEEDENGIAEVTHIRPGYGNYEVRFRCLDQNLILLSKVPLSKGTRFRLFAFDANVMRFDEKGISL